MQVGWSYALALAHCETRLVAGHAQAALKKTCASVAEWCDVRIDYYYWFKGLPLLLLRQPLWQQVDIFCPVFQYNDLLRR